MFVSVWYTHNKYWAICSPHLLVMFDKFTGESVVLVNSKGEFTHLWDTRGCWIMGVWQSELSIEKRKGDVAWETGESSAVRSQREKKLICEGWWRLRTGLVPLDSHCLVQ